VPDLVPDTLTRVVAVAQTKSSLHAVVSVLSVEDYGDRSLILLRLRSASHSSQPTDVGPGSPRLFGLVASDDLGRRYEVGAPIALERDDGFWRATLTLTPSLDPSARSLTIEFSGLGTWTVDDRGSSGVRDPEVSEPWKFEVVLAGERPGGRT